MKRLFILLLPLLTSVYTLAATGITYNGQSLTLNTEFTRTQTGKAYKSVLPEVSGMACSRTTPGYIWIEGDEDNEEIIAIQPNGTEQLELELKGVTKREDWEDICTGVYNGQNYVFVGAFGDNDCQYKDEYYIYYFVEPTIPSKAGEASVNVQYIKFGYPDGKGHNTEALMYDNIEQVLYIVDKVADNVCSVFSLPFNLNYGTKLQTLTKVCELGKSGEKSFQTVTAADISPDGKWMIIKNNIKDDNGSVEAYALMWERKGSESISETVKRQPVQIAAYQLEDQGESVAWLDSTTFYTTSDKKKDTPIYKYVRVFKQGGGEGGDDDDKDTPGCGTIIQVEVTGKTSSNISGSIGGTADQSLSDSRKLDKSKYFGITLTSGNFLAGDTVTYTMAKAGDLAHIVVYADKDRKTIIYEDTKTAGGTIVQFVLTAPTQSIYLSRPDGDGWNPTIESVHVRRACNETTTGVESIEKSKNITIRKEIYRGQLILLVNGVRYSATGQRLY